jgi:hypothetical protein
MNYAFLLGFFRNLAEHSFKSCNTNISVCLLLQVPTQFAWLDIIVKERFSAALAARGAYFTHRVFSVNTFLKKDFLENLGFRRLRCLPRTWSAF